MKNPCKNYQMCCAVLLIALFLTAASSLAKGSAPVAELQGYKGTVKIKKSGEKAWSKGYAKSMLHEGDGVALPEGGKATILFYNDMHTEVVSGKCEVEIGEKRCSLIKGEKSQIKNGLVFKGIVGAPSMQIKSINFSGVPDRAGWGDVQILTPLSRITTLRPAIHWKQIPEADGYEVVLFRRNERDTEIFRCAAKDGLLSFPVGQKDLMAGSKYLCEIDAKDGKKVLTKGYVEFETASGSEIKEKEGLRKEMEAQMKKDPQDITPLLVLFDYCISHGLMDDAFTLCTKLTTLKPDDRNLHLWLAALYEFRGQKREAEKERAKAEAICDRQQ